MKTVILAGGLGTRISEESHLRPKPMIEVGGKPILWHIMKLYSHYGYNDFIICCGYKGYVIKEYFSNYFLHSSDITFDFSDGNHMVIHNNIAEPWKVTLVDTGLNTMTGGRIKRVRPYIPQGERFMLTYGDGLSDVDISRLLESHRQSRKLATLTAVQLGGRFGSLLIESDMVRSFREKPRGDGGWINGGFFVLEYKVLDYIDSDSTTFEQQPLERLSSENQLHSYQHHGFWQPMDTLRDKEYLEGLWHNDPAPWQLWQ